MAKIKDNISYMLIIICLAVLTSTFAGEEAAFGERLLPAIAGAIIGLVAIVIYILLFRNFTKIIESNNSRNKFSWAKVSIIGFIIATTGYIISFYIHGQVGYTVVIIGFILCFVSTILHIKSLYDRNRST